MGKYDEVLGDLKPAPIADLKHQEKVNARKTELTVDETTGELKPLTADELARRYADVRFEKAQLDAEKSKLQVTIDALEQLMIQSWERDEDGWGAYGASPNVLRLKDGASVQIEPQPEGKVEDPEAFRLWCLAPPDVCMICGGREDALGHEATDEGPEANQFTHHTFKPGGGLEKKLQLMWQTMNAIAKERCKAGAPPPDGVAVYARTTVKFNKA